MIKRTLKNKVSLKNKVARGLWNLTYLVLFRPFGTRLFRKWRLFILYLWGAKVTKSSSIYASTKITAPWNLILKENAGIGPHTIIYNHDLVEVGENAKVSQYCYICTAGHDIQELNSSKSGLITAPILIGDRAWIAANAFIGMGVTIGQGAVVGARAAVFKDVEPWTVVGGNPAKFIKKREIKD